MKRERIEAVNRKRIEPLLLHPNRSFGRKYRQSPKDNIRPYCSWSGSLGPLSGALDPITAFWDFQSLSQGWCPTVLPIPGPSPPAHPCPAQSLPLPSPVLSGAPGSSPSDPNPLLAWAAGHDCLPLLGIPQGSQFPAQREPSAHTSITEYTQESNL